MNTEVGVAEHDLVVALAPYGGDASANQPFPIQCCTDLYSVTEPTERFPLIQGFTECTESVLLCTDLYTHLPFVQV